MEAVAQESAQRSEPANGAQPITGILGQFRGLSDELSIGLARLVREVRDNSAGKKGELTLKLTVEPATKKNLTGNQVLIAAQVTVKSPTEPATGRVFFYDEQGGLHVNDPHQNRMFDGPKGV